MVEVVRLDEAAESTAVEGAGEGAHVHSVALAATMLRHESTRVLRSSLL